jgi:transglutaminase-like putative cysteine protease
MIMKNLVLLGTVLAISWYANEALGDTYAVQYKKYDRKLHITRHYEIPVEPGKPVRAFVPAMISFWGATNWQVVKTSDFKYSETPDDVKITADDHGMPRHNYCLTWKAPKSNTITVDQTLDVELKFSNKLFTTAKLPYPADVKKRFADSLAKDEEGGINPNNETLFPICDKIVKRAANAEAVVEGVCDWINENIKFVRGKRTAEEALAQRQGSCTPMSQIACSMLRHIGIPAEVVSAKSIGSDGGHSYIEVYFPDAGWVFYDVSNLTRGYKTPDCLLTVGWSFRVQTPINERWIEGHFCVAKDTTPYRNDDFAKPPRLVRKTPPGEQVLAVTVLSQKPPTSVRPRHRSIRELILDASVPAEPREYEDDATEK